MIQSMKWAEVTESPHQGMACSFVALLSPCIVRFAIRLQPPLHTVQCVWCVYGNVCVTHRHIWISKSVCVCLCQCSDFAFEHSFLCGLPWMPYWESLSLSLIICLMSKRKDTERKKREGWAKGNDCVFFFYFIQQKAAVVDLLDVCL